MKVLEMEILRLENWNFGATEKNSTLKIEILRSANANYAPIKLQPRSKQTPCILLSENGNTGAQNRNSALHPTHALDQRLYREFRAIL